MEIRRSGDFDGDVTILHGVTGDTAMNESLAEGTEVTAFALISASVASLSAPRTSRISILDDEEPSPPPPTEPPLTALYDVSRQVAVSGLDVPVRFAFGFRPGTPDRGPPVRGNSGSASRRHDAARSPGGLLGHGPSQKCQPSDHAIIPVIHVQEY